MHTFRAIAPTPDELLAHAQAHPIAPGSDAGWWLLMGHEPRLIAARPWWGGAEFFLDGRWCRVRRGGGLRPGDSIAPLTTTGDAAPWPAPLLADQCVALELPDDVADVLRNLAARDPSLASRIAELAAMMGDHDGRPAAPVVRLALVRPPVDGPGEGGAA
jgi:hypothetical protein